MRRAFLAAAIALSAGWGASALALEPRAAPFRPPPYAGPLLVYGRYEPAIRARFARPQRERRRDRRRGGR